MNKGISISGRVNTTSGGGSQATDLRRPRMITPFVRFVTFNSFCSNFFYTMYLDWNIYIFRRQTLHIVKLNLMVPTKGLFKIQKLFANLLFAILSNNSSVLFISRHLWLLIMTCRFAALRRADTFITGETCAHHVGHFSEGDNYSQTTICNSCNSYRNNLDAFKDRPTMTWPAQNCVKLTQKTNESVAPVGGSGAWKLVSILPSYWSLNHHSWH